MLKSRLNKIDQQDPFVTAIANALQIELDSIEAVIVQTNDDIFFDTCSETMLKAYEAEAGITPLASQSLSDRRSAVAAKWKSTGKCDINLLQAIADSWKYGKVLVDFVDNKIKISFADKGIPLDLDGLKAALEEVRPAHLPITYIFVYNTWADVKKLTWAQVKTGTWENLKVR